MTNEEGRPVDVVSGIHEAFDNSWYDVLETGGSAPRGDAKRAPRPATKGVLVQAGYFIDGAEAFAAAAVDRWLDISSARAGRRAMVGGSHITGDGVGSYWWQAEDVIGADGRPMKHPTATHWRR